MRGYSPFQHVIAARADCGGLERGVYIRRGHEEKRDTACQRCPLCCLLSANDASGGLLEPFGGDSPHVIVTITRDLHKSDEESRDCKVCYNSKIESHAASRLSLAINVKNLCHSCKALSLMGVLQGACLSSFRARLWDFETDEHLAAQNVRQERISYNAILQGAFSSC